MCIHIHVYMHVCTHSCVCVQDDLKDKKMKDMMFAMTAFDTDEPQRLNQSSNLSVQANDESCGKMQGDYTHCNTLIHAGTKCVAAFCSANDEVEAQ